jgi:hypothetical protein
VGAAGRGSGVYRRDELIGSCHPPCYDGPRYPCARLGRLTGGAAAQARPVGSCHAR